MRSQKFDFIAILLKFIFIVNNFVGSSPSKEIVADNTKIKPENNSESPQTSDSSTSSTDADADKFCVRILCLKQENCADFATQETPRFQVSIRNEQDPNGTILSAWTRRYDIAEFALMKEWTEGGDGWDMQIVVKPAKRVGKNQALKVDKTKAFAQLTFRFQPTQRHIFFYYDFDIVGSEPRMAVHFVTEPKDLWPRHHFKFTLELPFGKGWRMVLFHCGTSGKNHWRMDGVEDVGIRRLNEDAIEVRFFGPPCPDDKYYVVLKQNQNFSIMEKISIVCDEIIVNRDRKSEIHNYIVKKQPSDGKYNCKLQKVESPKRKSEVNEHFYNEPIVTDDAWKELGNYGNDDLFEHLIAEGINNGKIQSKDFPIWNAAVDDDIQTTKGNSMEQQDFKRQKVEIFG